jgi:hypothetical protein
MMYPEFREIHEFVAQALGSSSRVLAILPACRFFVLLLVQIGASLDLILSDPFSNSVDELTIRLCSTIDFLSSVSAVSARNSYIMWRF